METSEAPRPTDEAATKKNARLGRYRVGARLGRGGAASVYFGLLPDPCGADRRVALKLIHEHLADERQFIDMFLDEAKIAVRLAHPNIVRAFEMGQEGNQLFLVMEYLHGQPMHKLFFRGSRNGRKLPLDVVAWIGASVARGLHYAHNLSADDGTPLGLVHRDVGPRNIFIGHDGSVKLIDFGIARAQGRLARTKVGQMKGTFSYVAPERALGGDCDHRADIFSLGIVLFEACVGQRLFRGEDDVQTLANVLRGTIPDPVSLRPDIPPSLTGILRRALAMRPEDRFASGDEFATALESFAKTHSEPDVQSRLAQLMEELFSAEREAQEKAIAAMEAGHEGEQPGCADAHSEAPDMAMASTSSGSLRTAAMRTPRAVWATMATAATLCAVAGVAYFAARSAIVGQRTTALAGYSAPPVSPAPTEPAPPTDPSLIPPVDTISLEVDVQPNVTAHVEIGGTEITQRPPKVTVPRGEEVVSVRVRADGYDEAALEVVPNANRVMSVVLREASPVVPPSATPPSSGSQPVVRRRSGANRTEPATLNDMLNRRH